ncbi:hypothetical protein LXL04_005749 [Taraxacum kok-saghyz]
MIYHAIRPLNWLRKRPGWTEIIRPGATRFGTAFIALQSLYGHKADLQAMVISNDFKKMLKVGNALELMTPLLRLLRLCDTDEKPALGYVYEGMHRARKGVKELFKKKKELYKPYTNIIDRRWDRMLRKSIHCAAYWLNPNFQFNRESFCSKSEVVSGVLEMVEKFSLGVGHFDLTMMLGKFREAVGTFGRASAIASRTTMRPDELWRLFGGDVPMLQKFAIRILSQTASSSGCERNWSVFEMIHTKKRNRLEHQRLNDLVFVHYNLRLQNRLKVDKRSYDPIDYECIDKTDFWVVEEEPEGELDYNDIENMLDEQEQEPASQTQENENHDVSEANEVDTEFHLLSDREIDAFNTPISQYSNHGGFSQIFFLMSLSKIENEGSTSKNSDAISDREYFELSGPTHLTTIDWTNPDHRRSIAACLVQGVYITELDRQENRQPPLAPPWWQSFNFDIHSQLIDDADSSIFGTIYKSKNPQSQSTPSYIIAFRGTVTKGNSFSRDLELDIHIIKNGLHQSSRFQIAMQAVKNLVTENKKSNIWLTGHSLGSAMALLTGKKMAKSGILLDSYLFNPPFFSAPLENIKDQNIKHGIRIASSFLTAGLAVAAKIKNANQQNLMPEDSFLALAGWVPCLYVNPGDHICSEYIGYFEHRKKMDEIGAGGIEKLATQHSISGVFLNAIGKESHEPLHLLPSARTAKQPYKTCVSRASGADMNDPTGQKEGLDVVRTLSENEGKWTVGSPGKCKPLQVYLQKRENK